MRVPPPRARRAGPGDWGGGRLVLGFLIAPAPSALLFGLAASRSLMPADRAEAVLPLSLLALVVHGYLPLLVVGLPLFHASRTSAIVRNPFTLMLAGGLIAAFPAMAIATWAAIGPDRQGDGAPPLAVLSGLLGALSGLVFWAVAFWSPRRPMSRAGR